MSLPREQQQRAAVSVARGARSGPRRGLVLVGTGRDAASHQLRPRCALGGVRVAGLKAGPARLSTMCAHMHRRLHAGNFQRVSHGQACRIDPRQCTIFGRNDSGSARPGIDESRPAGSFLPDAG
ncbi:hypothetical protein HPB50_004441 [Hyalomma asiaticum]|uniref:Uncharacterized protein n=1 Tax=Hyalomma asiaticum TaxID=266040 RepID=A0ACB7TIJ8_HYAAI|nr:hypothetical protein HPB50_004441 [Hyalomma asiaticum]